MTVGNRIIWSLQLPCNSHEQRDLPLNISDARFVIVNVTQRILTLTLINVAQRHSTSNRIDLKRKPASRQMNSIADYWTLWQVGNSLCLL